MKCGHIDNPRTKPLTARELCAVEAALGILAEGREAFYARIKEKTRHRS